MDLASWGFRYWPFDRTFAADRFFASPQHDEAMSRLLFLVEESRRCGLVTGAAGTGKTYLMSLTQQRAQRLGRMVVRCDATGLTCEEVLLQVATASQVPCDLNSTAAQLWYGLRARFAALSLIRQPVVLLIDHLDSSDGGVLQAIRRLNQLADLVGLKLTIVLAVTDQVVPALLQDMVELRIELNPWSVGETSQFIHDATRQAGRLQRLFTEEAIQGIQEITRGIPAKIVSLANLSLLAVGGNEVQVVTRDCVEAAAAEFLPQAQRPGGFAPSPATGLSKTKRRPSSVGMLGR